MKKALINHNPEKGKGKENSNLKEALIASELRYRRLFESAKDGILILDAETGMIVDVNPFLIDLLGYSKKEFVEKSIWEIGAFQDIFENKEKFFELQQKEYVRYDDLPIVTSDGRKIHVEFVSNVYLANNIKAIQCNIRDNTERTNILNEIKFQADLINNVGQAVIATDLLGIVIYWNNAAEKIYGWSPSEAIGQNIIHLTSALQTNEQAIKIMKKLSAGKIWAGEFPVKRKDGSSFTAFITDTPMFDSNGKLTGIIGISSDITERKRAEIELIESKEKAEESDRLKSAFLANMSHEIRTPMNGILGFTELLKTPKLTGTEQQKYIGIIEKSGARMLNIINDIINISKIESGQIELSVSNFNINEKIADIYNFFEPEAIQKNLNFSFKNGLPASEAFIKTDKDKLYAVLTNLVKNALKFTKSGSVELGYKVNGDFFEFYIKDSGTGISHEQRAYIFERFRQGSESLTRNYEGAGLGLAISKAYIEVLGGTIWVESEFGNGSTFYFTIPYINKSKEKIQLHSVAEEESNKNRKLKIVVAEDDETSRILLNIMIKDMASEIYQVENSIDAVEACRNNSDIDLVLLDIKMSDMDGYEATRQIRKFNKEVIIIAQTAYGLSSDREKSIAAGCNDYISKPIYRKALQFMINKYFN